MVNRKIGTMKAKPTQQRTKGRQKKEKPVLKTPTVLKIKIPHTKTKSVDVENQQANEIKFNKNNINIMLANEVIRAQFPKKLKEPITEIQNDKPIKRTINKKTILNRKRVLRNSNTVSEEKNTAEYTGREPVKRRNCKILAKQINAKLMDNLPEDPEHNPVVSPKPVKRETSKPVKLRRRACVRGVNTSPEENVSPDNKDLQTKPKTVAKRKLSVKSKPGPLTRKRKVNGAKDVKEEIVTKDVLKEVTEISSVVPKNRLNSRSSSISEFSWTKDISSSSATLVTVSSHDFFRIDKKLPLVMLNNEDCELKYSDQKCINVSDSVCAENNGSKSQNNCENDINIPYPSLNLSTTSCDSCSQSVQSTKSVVVLNRLSETLNKLSSKLKNFDLEVINWIGCTNEKTNNHVDIFTDKMIQGGFLKEERDVIVTCKEINRIIANDGKVDTETKIPVTNEVEFNKISNGSVLNKDLQNDEYKKVISTETNTDLNNLMGKQSTPLEDNDDDDALSLFAESITGIVSSRRNSSVAGISDLPEVEEYVPKPVFKNTFKSPKITYQPSKIALMESEVADNNVTTANFCEKQNADSTSIYKENESSAYNNLIYEDRIGYFSKNVSQNNSNSIQRNNSSPRLMASIHKPKQGIHSYVFKGVCFFYLISSCKKTICNFPHSFMKIEDVKNKFALISEHEFIEEYMMVRQWPQLRRMYGQCFVEECIKRELSRFVVEMAIDFIMKAKETSRDDNILKIDIVENILLYLNKVDLSTCSDLLSYKVQNFTRVLLCDFFMNTIAGSQNFSQFKTVFINLTEFMCNIQRTFNINAATLILERVSILPYDEGLARALIKILKNTDTALLSNSMIGNLEMQLMSSNLGLYDELMGLHERIHTNHAVLANCYDKMPNEGASSVKINNNLVTNNDIRYSPDTTNFDNVNKTLEPIITRTIDLNKIQPHRNNKIPKSNNEGSKKKYNNWTNRTIFDNIRNKQLGQSMKPPKRPGFKQKSNQNLETRSSIYQRRGGPSFSQGFL